MKTTIRNLIIALLIPIGVGLLLWGITSIFNSSSVDAIRKASGGLPADVQWNAWPDGNTLEDNQGAVSVVVTPINLSQAGNSVSFDVALNTHSVELSMNLAALATLTSDSGLELPAASWDAPLGGHHTAGTLTFETGSAESAALEQATEIKLVIQNLDAP
ncbi:MAG: hypothetical protein HND51_24360, partial [Chloroflexi bacterium]|nr:hypothetical protein [Chloroflexota bacterium]NOH14782.1 hypothetical protein [Chloroflexota bacterium]